MCRERPWKLQAEPELQGWGGRGRGRGVAAGGGVGCGVRWGNGRALSLRKEWEGANGLCRRLY